MLVHPGDVRALDQFGEEANELHAFGGRPLRPVLPEGSLRHLAEVEYLVGGDDDGASALVELLVAVQLGVAEDFEHPVDPGAQLIAGRACPSAASGDEREQENQDPENARVVSDHE